MSVQIAVTATNPTVYRCYSTTTGRDRRYSGCSHETPRQAIRHTANHEPYTSPLRESGMSTPVTPHAGNPPPDATGVVLIPEPRKRGSRRRGMRRQ